MKRIFLAIMAIAVIISMITISSVFAVGQNIELHGTSATIGMLADMRVVLSGSEEISELTLKFSYDSSALIMYDVKDMGILGNPCHGYSEEDECFVLSWEGGSGNGTLAIITFMVTGNAEVGRYSVTVASDDEEVASGYITVTEEAVGDVDGDGELSEEDAVALSKKAANWNDFDVLGNSGDVNGDGKVNLLDALIIARNAAKLSGYTINSETEDVSSPEMIELEVEE